MENSHPPDSEKNGAYVSTGRLPPGDQVRTLVAEAHARFQSNKEGKNSQVYPALAQVPDELFGICVVGTNGTVHAVGDSDFEFTIMSVSKPFLFALVCQAAGVEATRQKVGVNATGRAFNSLEGIERNPDGRTNPMVNSGAIATTSLVPGDSLEAKWRFIHDGLSRFAGRPLPLNEEVYASATETNYRNQSIARLLQSFGRIYMDPAEAVDLYTKQCALNVSAKDLAVMGATLADGGVNPVTKQRVVDPQVCHYALAVMATAGLYETSGDWLFDIGLPGKSGIGGGIVTVSPGKGGLGTFAPPLDSAGNSVKGQLVAKFLSQRLGMDLFISRPEA
ncbi:MAG: glutaminase A [Verrucomicrobiales bacterium]